MRLLPPPLLFRWSRCGSAVALLILASGVSTFGQAQKPAPQTPPSKQEAQPDLINPDRPGIADGSTVIGPRRFQIETAYQNEFRKDAGNTERRIFVPTLLRFGFSSQWEGRIESNTYTFARVTAPGVNAMETAGMSPLSLGFKYHFQDQTEVRKRASLGTIFRLFPASGSSDFRANHTTGDLRLAADWDFTPSLSLNPNVGVGVYEDGNGHVFTTGLFALTLNYFNRARTINPFIDMGFQAPEERYGRSSLTFDAGIAFIIGHDIQLDLSAGTGTLGRTPPHPFIAAGISARFSGL